MVDDLHPRHLALLPTDALEYVADLFELWEYLGEPVVTDPTLMVKMLPKASGGFRPIGLFPTLFRV